MAFGSRLLNGAAIVRAVAGPFERPDRVARALVTVLRWNRGMASLAGAAAVRSPDTVAIIDHQGETTYREIWRRAHAIADGLRSTGIGEGSAAGVLTTNHRGFLEQVIGIAISGADLVLLNPGFAAPQLADVIGSEGIAAVLHDDGLAEVVGTAVSVENDKVAHSFGEAEIAGWIDHGLARDVRVPPPAHEGRTILLTSGTTGRPKGATHRNDPRAGEAVGGLLARVPLRARDVQVVGAPMFHAWGFSHLLLGIARSATTVVTPKFDGDRLLEAVERHRARVLVVVPVMLQRMLELDRRSFDSRDLSCLEVVAVSGSALPGRVVSEWTQRVGPMIYNAYGSTEVALATVATPEDLRRAVDTVGRPIPGVEVEILDEQGNPVASGETGEIFVGSAGRFHGYTTGEGKREVRGLLSTGDLGRFDAQGLLFVEGRADDMIVSGGENVFPGEVEELLRTHPAIADAAVVGVPDDEFGEVLAAHVVLRKDQQISTDEVRRFVREHLARFKVPRSVHIVDEIPRTTSGKPLKRQLVDGNE